jgi:hypothetical protein
LRALAIGEFARPERQERLDARGAPGRPASSTQSIASASVTRTPLR